MPSCASQGIPGVTICRYSILSCLLFCNIMCTCQAYFLHHSLVLFLHALNALSSYVYPPCHNFTIPLLITGCINKYLLLANSVFEKKIFCIGTNLIFYVATFWCKLFHWKPSNVHILTKAKVVGCPFAGFDRRSKKNLRPVFCSISVL